MPHSECLPLCSSCVQSVSFNVWYSRCSGDLCWVCLQPHHILWPQPSHILFPLPWMPFHHFLVNQPLPAPETSLTSKAAEDPPSHFLLAVLISQGCHCWITGLSPYYNVYSWMANSDQGIPWPARKVWSTNSFPSLPLPLHKQPLDPNTADNSTYIAPAAWCTQVYRGPHEKREYIWVHLPTEMPS